MTRLFDGHAGFTRHDLYKLPAAEQAEAANGLGLPHFAACFESIGACQACESGGMVRRYVLDLLTQGFFVIRSPITGQPLRSGGSVLLADKSVLFCFPDEPEVMVGIGDLSLGYPIVALVLPALFLPVADSMWGFAERHLPLAAAAIRETGWSPAPGQGALILVSGDANFAHYAWNQLSALNDLARHDLRGDVRVIVTQQPLGPMHAILPDLPPWPVEMMPDTSLQAQNRTGLVFVPVGAHFITAGLCKRIHDFAARHMSAVTQQVDAALAAVEGPVLWMSVRTRNRTALNQHAVLEALGSGFLDAAPEGAVLIDGHSVADDLEAYPVYHRDEAAEVLAADWQAVVALREALERRHSGRVHVAAGLRVSDSIALARRASLYFCHHGTVQHKIGWFTATPGVVHSNHRVLEATPAQWVADQSEVAVAPVYLPPGVVEDEADVPGEHAPFAHLLHHENYTITDIPAVVALVLGQGRAAGLLTRPVALTPDEGKGPLGELAAAQATIAQQADYIRALEGSSSWKLTAPLRMLSRLFRRRS